MTFTKKPGSRIIMPFGFKQNIQEKMHDMQIVILIIMM